MMPFEARSILDFWYTDRVKQQWFVSTPELDQEILDKFEAVWEQALNGDLDHWMNEAESSLALVIVLDQFPLNMFRGAAKAFKSERKSVEVTLHALDHHFDQLLDKDKLAFLLMPLMHSEELSEQNLSVSLFKEHQLESNLRFAKHHREIVKKYGRFPHRNHILGRKNTEEETQYLNSNKAFKG